MDHLLSFITGAESGVIVVGALLAAVMAFDNATRAHSGQRFSRRAKGAACLLLGLLYGARLFVEIPGDTFSLLVRPLIMVLMWTIAASNLKEPR